MIHCCFRLSALFLILQPLVNLYYRVSELCTESGETKAELGLTEAPLVEWWANFTATSASEYCHWFETGPLLPIRILASEKGYSKEDDMIAKTLFPFIL
jgi:hypothetical protein